MHPGRTYKHTIDHQQRAGGTLVSQPSPAWLRRTARPAPARPELHLGLPGLPARPSVCTCALTWARMTRVRRPRGRPAAARGGIGRESLLMVASHRAADAVVDGCDERATCLVRRGHRSTRDHRVARGSPSLSLEWSRTLPRRNELDLVEDDRRGARTGSCPGNFPDNCHLSSLSQRASLTPMRPPSKKREHEPLQLSETSEKICRVGHRPPIIGNGTRYRTVS